MSGHGLTLWMNGATSKSSVPASAARALSAARAAESEANSISTDARLLVVCSLTFGGSYYKKKHQGRVECGSE